MKNKIFVVFKNLLILIQKKMTNKMVNSFIQTITVLNLRINYKSYSLHLYMSQKYLKPIIAASLVIMIYQGIANSNLGIVSQFTHQNGNNWAGPLSTALLFLGSGLASNYNQYIGKYPFKFCFFVGSFGYTIFTSLGLLFLKLGFTTTVQVLIFVLSFIAGATCSIFYNTQFNYTNFLAKIDKKEVKYFGINMGITQSSNIFGNLLSALLIQPLGQFVSVLVLSITIFVTSFFFLFFKQPQKQQMMLLDQTQKEQTPKDSIVNSQSENESYNNGEQIYKGRPPFLAHPTFIFSGIIISFIYCLLSIIIYQTFEDKMADTELNRLTFVLFIFQGVGELIGGIAIIFLSKYIKDVAKTLMITNTLFMISVAIIMLGSRLQNPYVIGLGVFLTGFSDCSSFSLSLTLAGNWKQSGITAFNMCQSLTVATTVMMSSFIPVWASLLWTGSFYLCNVVCMFLYSKKTHLHIRNNQQ